MAQLNYAYNDQGQQVRRYNGSVIRHAMCLEDGRWLGEYDNAGAALQNERGFARYPSVCDVHSPDDGSE